MLYHLGSGVKLRLRQPVGPPAGGPQPIARGRRFHLDCAAHRCTRHRHHRGSGQIERRCRCSGLRCGAPTDFPFSRKGARLERRPFLRAEMSEPALRLARGEWAVSCGAVDAIGARQPSSSGASGLRSARRAPPRLVARSRRPAARRSRTRPPRAARAVLGVRSSNGFAVQAPDGVVCTPFPRPTNKHCRALKQESHWERQLCGAVRSASSTSTTGSWAVVADALCEACHRRRRWCWR